MTRVVSLLPSATEIVCALGAADELVGISHECDFPESIRDRPVVTRSRIDPHGTSRAIDTAVRAAIVPEALSIYAVDDGMLAELRPDLIVTQDLCEVCAVSLDDVRGAVARFSHHEGVRIVSLRPTRLGDVLDDVVRVAEALGRRETGVLLRRSLEARMREIATRAAIGSRPRVASVEWIEPLMLGGTWMPELIELAGGRAVGVSAGQAAPTISPSDLVALAPEIVIVKPCGFTLERALAERDLIDSSIVRKLDARVYVTDGNAFFNRPGPRLVESLEILASCVHPDELADLGRRHASSLVRLA